MSDVTRDVTAEYAEARKAAAKFDPGGQPDISGLMKSAYMHGYADALLRAPPEATGTRVAGTKPVCPNCQHIDIGARLPSDHGGRFFFTRCDRCNHGYRYNTYGEIQQPVEPQGWQPIETAPTDGQWFIVYCAGTGWTTLAQYLPNGHTFVTQSLRQQTSLDPAPTHWRPLPGAPVTKTGPCLFDELMGNPLDKFPTTKGEPHGS